MVITSPRCGNKVTRTYIYVWATFIAAIACLEPCLYCQTKTAAPDVLWRKVVYSRDTSTQDMTATNVMLSNRGTLYLYSNCGRRTLLSEIDTTGEALFKFDFGPLRDSDTSYYVGLAVKAGDSFSIYGFKGLTNLFYDGPYTIIRADLIDTAEISNVTSTGKEYTGMHNNFFRFTQTSLSDSIAVTASAHDTIQLGILDGPTGALSPITMYKTYLSYSTTPTITQLRNNRYVLSGECYDPHTFTLHKNYAILVDKKGDEISRLQFDTKYNRFFTLTADTSGYYFAYIDSASTSYLTKIVHCDYSGNIIHEMKTSRDLAVTPYLLRLTNDGGIIVVGMASTRDTIGDQMPIETQTEAYIAKYDRNFNLQWQDVYGYPGLRDRYTTILELPGGRYVAGGGCMYDPKGIQATERILCSYYGDSNRLTSVIGSREQVTVPKCEIIESAEVHFTGVSEGSIVNLYNVRGELVISTLSDNKRGLTLDISSLLPGFYAWTMLNTSNTTNGTFVIVR